MADEYDFVVFPDDESGHHFHPRGLPIGTLTSQFCSNCYLNPLDWFAVRELGCLAYLRYVNDFALFADSKRQLTLRRERTITFLTSPCSERERSVLPSWMPASRVGSIMYGMGTRGG